MSEYGNEYGAEDDHDQPFDKEEHYKPRIEDEPYDHDGNPNPDYMDKSQEIPVKDTVDYQEEDIPKEKENVYELIDKVSLPLPTGIHFIEDPITSIAPSTDSKVNGEHETPIFKSNSTDLGSKSENDEETHEKVEINDNIDDRDEKKENKEFEDVFNTETTEEQENEFNGVFDIKTTEEQENEFDNVLNVKTKEGNDTSKNKREEQINKEDFRNLEDSELQRYFKEYFEKTGKKANRGLQITNIFKNFLNNYEKIPYEAKKELLEKTSKINENNEIENFLKNQIKFTSLSQNKIRKIIREMGLGIASDTVKKIAIENVYNGDLEKYWGRFPASKDKIPKEIKESIKIDIKSDNPGTQEEIARKHGVSESPIRKIAKEILTTKEYKKTFPSLKDKIPEEIKESIKTDIKSDNSLTLTDFARIHGVSDFIIAKIAKEILTTEEYKKRFPAPEKISEDIKGSIKIDIMSDNSGTKKDLAEKHGVSPKTIGKIAKEILTPKELKEKFPSDIPAEIGTITHRCINDLITKDFDVRRKNAPNIPKIFSEPRIYQPLSKKHADMGFLNDTKYLQELLTNPKYGNSLNRELEIDLNKLDHIKFVQFDYTNLLNKKNIIDKIEKYQHPDVMTFIVGTKWDRHWKERTKKLPFDERIKYPENTKIINDECFLDLMNIKGTNKVKFEEIMDLNKKGDLDNLKEILEKERQYLHNIDEIRDDLRKKSLIKRYISEYINNIEIDKQPEGTLDQFIYNKNNDKEQKKDMEFEGIFNETKEHKEDKEFEGVLYEIKEEKVEVKREDVSDDNIEDAKEDESDNESDNYYENY